MITRKEAEDIITQIATNKLGLTRAEALTGSDPDFWRAKLLYTTLGISENPHCKRILDVLESRAIASSMMAKAETLARAAAVIPELDIDVERPNDNDETPTRADILEYVEEHPDLKAFLDKIYTNRRT